MENKVYYKRFLISFFVISFGLIILFTIINIREYSTYRKSVNNKLASIIETVREKYPDISDAEILDLLKSKDFQENPLKEYSYDLDKDEIISSMKSDSKVYITVEIALFIITIFLLLLLFKLYDNRKNKELHKITKIIENINRKNYELEIENFSEDELSILKSEIYKTTIMLKEAAENSLEDKISVKNSLSDISHQLKTPLTSILIMLDNIIDDDGMSHEIRLSFIKDIKREILKINFLVQSILKLSKFESNTINFMVEDAELCDIIEKSIQNVSSLCDLKNITIDEEIQSIGKIKCDLAWQVEAFTNIIKNAIEHSPDGSKIIISTSENNVYKEIKIQDFGSGMDSHDIEHIFERFYKSKNATKDSTGIGLELAKKIIELSNGRINVSSNIGKGTTFMIKYYK